MPNSSDPFESWNETAEDLPLIETISALIGSIYDCALDPDLWDTTLISIQEMLRAHNASLNTIDLVNGRTTLIRTVGIDPYWLERLPLHGAEIASWERLPIASELPPDEPQVFSRHLPADIREQSVALREWAGPQGLVDSMGLTLIKSPTRYAHLGLGRHRNHGLYTEREVVLGRVLVPHIRRAVTIGDLIDMKAVETQRANQVLDALSAGVVLTDAEGKILHTNATAEAMMRAGTPIRGVGGTLRTNLPAATQELHAAIALADGQETALGKTGLAVRLTSSGEPPMLAHVLPLKQSEARARVRQSAAAAIFVGAVSSGANGAEAMSVAYGLSPMETRVLTGLLAGQTLQQVAEVLGVARSTARTHLDNIFAKTGVARQADLIRMAMQIATIVKSS
jgi:DNA-binding CsgD family transcriptional regulator/PAS domain-containing protein